MRYTEVKSKILALIYQEKKINIRPNARLELLNNINSKISNIRPTRPKPSKSQKPKLNDMQNMNASLGART